MQKLMSAHHVEELTLETIRHCEESEVCSTYIRGSTWVPLVLRAFEKKALR